MKKILIMLIMLMPILSHSQTVHLILFADTTDIEVGNASKSTYKYFKQKFVSQLKNVGFTVKPQYFMGNIFTRTNMNTAISNLYTSSNDIIIFYFTGHGRNDCEGLVYSEINDYPALLVGNNDGINTLSKLKSEMEVFRTLKNKPHKLLLVIAEACNMCASSNMTATRGGVSYSMIDIDMVKFKNLFLSSGDYLVSSCLKGEESYAGERGCFSKAFSDVLEEQTRKGYTGTPTWNSIFSATASLTTEYASKMFNQTTRERCIQHPQYKVDGSSYNNNSILTIAKPILENVFRNSNYVGNGGYGAHKYNNAFYFGEFSNDTPKIGTYGFYINENEIRVGKLVEVYNNTIAFGTFYVKFDPYGKHNGGFVTPGTGKTDIKLIATPKGNYYLGQVDLNGFYQGYGVFVWSDGRAWFGEWENGQQSKGGYIH